MAKQNFYTYPSMEKQLKQWTVQYSADYFRLDSIGRTPAKRHLYACHLGAADAPKQLVLTASIHGREYINTTLLLDMLAYYLPRYNHRELPDTPCYRELWRDVCIIFLPMTNPDGVSISQNTPAKKWKENSAAVDLNRNFPCGFGLSKDINKHNPGKSAGDQPETKHLMTFVSQLSTPLGVIHYHSQGSLIYYDYDVTGSLRNHIVKMASIAHATTGYPLIEAHGKNAGSTLPGGGFGDWCVYEKKIPSITIETGRFFTPVPHWQHKGIYDKNLLLLHNLLAGIL